MNLDMALTPVTAIAFLVTAIGVWSFRTVFAEKPALAYAVGTALCLCALVFVAITPRELELQRIIGAAWFVGFGLSLMGSALGVSDRGKRVREKMRRETRRLAAAHNANEARFDTLHSLRGKPMAEMHRKMHESKVFAELDEGLEREIQLREARGATEKKLKDLM